jgi:carbon monoxide dehydrogenase subunit G
MAEQRVNEFTVNRPIEQAWPVICDVERIAPCMPGAQLEEIEGDVYRGVVKIKLGAVSTQFKGEAQFVERDDVNHRAKLRAEGRDTGGRGNAAADITAEATSLSPTSTKCSVTTDLHITGKVAQFGRGIMGDVSKKLMEQFAANLNTMLDETALDKTPDAKTPDTATADTPIVDTSSEPTTTASSPAGGESSNGGSAAATPTKRVISGPASEPIDVAGMAGPALLKRIGPVVVGLLIVFLLLRRRR